MYRSCGYLILSFLLVGSAMAGEEPLAVQADQGHKLTTLCVQVREPPGQICGPVVGEDKARAAPGPQVMSQADSALMMEQMLRSSRPQMRAMPPPPGAVITDYIQGVPVFSMSRSAAQQQLAAQKAAQPPPGANFRAAEPCPDQPPAGRMVGPPAPMFAGGPGPYPGYAPQMRTPFLFAPLGAEPQQQQQLKQSEQQFISQQQMIQQQQMRAGARPDCPEDFQQQFMRNAPIPLRTFPPRVIPSGGFLRESSEALAKQCEEQEKQLQQKMSEIDGLKKEIERLSSASTSTAEKSTVVEKKTVTTKSQTQDKNESTVGENKQQKKENSGNGQGPVKRKR